MGAKQGWGEGKSFCCVWQGRGREWLWDWDLPAFLGRALGQGMSWVTRLPCHGSQSTCIRVTPSQLFRVWEVDITQPRPNDLPELTQQAALQLSIAPAPSVSTPTHSTNALRAQGLGGSTGQVGVWAYMRALPHTQPSSRSPVQVGTSFLLSVSKQQPECLTQSSGNNSHHLKPPSTLFPLTAHPCSLQVYRSTPSCEGLQEWILGYWGVASKTPSHSALPFGSSSPLWGWSTYSWPPYMGPQQSPWPLGGDNGGRRR